MDHDPETWNSSLRELIEQINEDLEKPKIKVIQPYHTVHCYAQWGGTQRMVLCGPLRLSDEGDEYMRWLDKCVMNSKDAK